MKCQAVNIKQERSHFIISASAVSVEIITPHGDTFYLLRDQVEDALKEPAPWDTLRDKDEAENEE